MPERARAQNARPDTILPEGRGVRARALKCTSENAHPKINGTNQKKCTMTRKNLKVGGCANEGLFFYYYYYTILYIIVVYVWGRYM